MEALRNLPLYVQIILGIAVVSFIVIKILPLIKLIKQIFGNYHKNPKGSKLSTEQLKAISIGAIYGEQIACYIDSLETGMLKSRLNKALSQYWGINSTASAKETLDWLNNEGHRMYYEKLTPILDLKERDAQKNYIEENFAYEDHETAIEYLDNLTGQMERLLNDYGVKQENINKGILAWDMGRMVIVARLAYDKKIITEQDTWEYINQALHKSKSFFKDWSEFAHSYKIGRTMWTGDDMMLDSICTIADFLQKDEESIWTKIEL